DNDNDNDNDNNNDNDNDNDNEHGNRNANGDGEQVGGHNYNGGDAPQFVRSYMYAYEYGYGNHIEQERKRDKNKDENENENRNENKNGNGNGNGTMHTNENTNEDGERANTTKNEKQPRTRKEAFKKWLEKKVELPQYMSLFEKSQIDDVKYLNQLSDENSLVEIGMDNLFHRNLFKEECKKYLEQKQKLQEWIYSCVGNNTGVTQYFVDLLERQGIYSLDALLTVVPNGDVWNNIVALRHDIHDLDGASLPSSIADKMYLQYHHTLWLEIQKEQASVSPQQNKVMEGYADNRVQDTGDLWHSFVRKGLVSINNP
ncbi:hypothetical protein RFI_04939, partial [Reticulomyxa filosa]